MAAQAQQRNAPTLRQRVGAAWKALTVKNLTIDEFYERVVEKLGHRVHSGQRVTEETALKLVTVFASIRVLAESMGSMPFNVLRNRPDSGADKMRDDPRWHLLRDEANPDSSALTFIETLTGHVASAGNGFAIIERDPRGTPTALIPWPSRSVRIDRDKETNILIYEFFEKGRLADRLPAEKVLHIPGFGYDGIVGYSPIHMAREAIGVGMARQEFEARFYGQGMMASTIFTTDGTLTDRSDKNLREWIEENASGQSNAWRPVVLDGGIKPERFDIPLKDAEFVLSTKLTDAQLSGLFRVPLHLINHHDGQPRASVEQLALEFATFSLTSWARRWEAEVNRKLFTRRERERGLHSKFNMDGLLRGNFKDRQEGLATQAERGALLIDEWRALEDRPPLPGGQGSVPLVSHNRQTLEEAIRSGAPDMDDEDMEAALNAIVAIGQSLKNGAATVAAAKSGTHN